jgi:8-oxo-dGTP diphosphatase
MSAAPPPRTLADIDWTRWKPQQAATLLFVVRNGQVLLIHKKRGLGAGKINAPGGRIEPGETPLEAAVREVREELCVEAVHVRRCGELSFQFVDGLGLHCTVFRAEDCIGEATETPEAIPLWVPVNQIPYEKMWRDDPLWVPLMLARVPFRGRFLFDGDAMLDHCVERRDEAIRSPAP